MATQTKAFCTGCGINWAALHSYDDEQNDETYEYCPLCKTDSFLTDPKDEAFYIYCFDKMINVETREPWKDPNAKPIVVSEYKKTRSDAADEKRAAKKKEDLLLLEQEAEMAYQTVLSGHGIQAAERMRTRIIKNGS